MATDTPTRKKLDLSLSKRHYEAAQRRIPGGVNSPARAFKSVGGTPLFIDHAKGAYMTDVDGNRYVDYIGSGRGDQCSLGTPIPMSSAA